VITNLKGEGHKLRQRDRERAGTFEHVQDEVKNELGGGHTPNQPFDVNTTWFKLALLTYEDDAQVLRHDIFAAIHANYVPVSQWVCRSSGRR